MNAIEALRARFPEAAKDIKLNLQAVLQAGAPLNADQRWGVALACALASRNAALSAAIAADAAGQASPAALEDARAAAVLMGMNNVYYRFRHLVGKASYAQLAPKLRMNRLAQPAGSKLDFELYSLAVSAINACETCIQAHERTLLAGGLGEEVVHEAVRIASVVHAAAIAVELGEAAPTS
jgi:alkyl hydroperoxide reductase subunit D